MRKGVISSGRHFITHLNCRVAILYCTERSKEKAEGRHLSCCSSTGACFCGITPRWNTSDAEFKNPFAENPEFFLQSLKLVKIKPCMLRLPPGFISSKFLPSQFIHLHFPPVLSQILTYINVWSTKFPVCTRRTKQDALLVVIGN